MAVFPFVILMGMLAFVFVLIQRRTEFRTSLQVSFFAIMIAALIDRSMASYLIIQCTKSQAVAEAKQPSNMITSVLENPEGVRMVEDFLKRSEHAGIATASGSPVR